MFEIKTFPAVTLVDCMYFLAQACKVLVEGLQDGVELFTVEFGKRCTFLIKDTPCEMFKLQL